MTCSNYGTRFSARVRARAARRRRVRALFQPQARAALAYYYYFDRIIVERHSYAAYRGTECTPGESGDAFIQCFVKTR